jgi:LysR family transcriptional regulator, cell division regulator
MAMPPSIELTYFYEVAIAANFSRAAKKINITQPTLSMAIKRLEKSLNTTLFYRQNNGVILTRAGQELFQHVKDLFIKWEEIKYKVVCSHHAVKGKVIIGCHSLQVTAMATVVSDLLAKYPELDIQINNGLSKDITEQVANTDIDIGLVLNPEEYANLIINKINTSDMAFWINKDEQEIQQALSSGKAMIICDKSIPQTNFLLEKGVKNKNWLARINNINTFEAIANLIIKGYGVGILPSCYVATHFPGSLRRLNKMPYLRSTLCLIYRNENKDVIVIQTVIKAIKEYINDHL